MQDTSRWWWRPRENKQVTVLVTVLELELHAAC